MEGLDAFNVSIPISPASERDGWPVTPASPETFVANYAAEAHAFNAAPAAGEVPHLHVPSIYASGRKIDDEYRYILDRRYAKKYPGNMLKRPGLILIGKCSLPLPPARRQVTGWVVTSPMMSRCSTMLGGLPPASRLSMADRAGVARRKGWRGHSKPCVILDGPISRSRGCSKAI